MKPNDVLSPSGRRNLRTVFDPRSVAIIGASNDESKYGNWISAQAVTMTDRDVYLVNRRGGEILGRRAYRSLAEIGAPVDLVVITVAAAAFEQAVEDALRAGATAIIGVSAGFAELGAEGRALEERVVARVRQAGAVLVGPNCLGLLDTSTGVRLASNPFPAGRIALLSQSGNMALELSQFLTGRDYGFSRFVSLGNQADLGVAEMVRECIDHDATELIAIYCEDFGNGRDFVAACSAAAEAGKPVLLLTVGSSKGAVRGAASHTGAMTSAAAVIKAACGAAGVYRVTTPKQLADTAATLLSFPHHRVERVAVIADGGGHASVACDVLEAAGLDVPEFEGVTAASLREFLPLSAGVRNPVDLASAAGRDITSFTRALEVALADPQVDAVLLTGYFGGYHQYGAELGAAEVRTAAQLARVAHEHGKPVLVHTMHPYSPAADELGREGIPVFATVGDAVNVLWVLSGSRRPRVFTEPIRPAAPLTAEDYWYVREVLRAAGIPFPAAASVTTVEEAVTAAEGIGYPVVVKAMGLLHKSDSGGVALALADASQLAQAMTRMQRELDPLGFSVEAMADVGQAVELIVGVHTDPRFGQIAMVGVGGIYTEVFSDVAFALAPVSAEEAKELLYGLKAAPLLKGVRGKPGVDVAAAAKVIADLTAFAAAHPEISELEINPMLVTPSGAMSVDARVLLHTTTP